MTELDDQQENRAPGVIIDLEALEAHAKDLFLDRFVEYVRKTRGDHGRYLRLRPGDQAAIRAADDGSAEKLDDISVSLDDRVTD